MSPPSATSRKTNCSGSCMSGDPDRRSRRCGQGSAGRSRPWRASTFSQVEGVLVAGSCPVRRLGKGFLVLGGEAFVDGFVDPFFAELAELADLAQLGE